jgi:hypothetical protein
VTPQVAYWLPEAPAGPCIPWEGSLRPDGYGRRCSGGRWRSAHRLAYMEQVGPIPDGLQIDHLCRNRACVNVGHMELVTQRENILRGLSPTAFHARKTHCPVGHPYDSENTYVARNGHRECRICRADAVRRHQARQKAQGLP